MNSGTAYKIRARPTKSGMANKDSVKMRPSYIRKNGIPAGRWGEVPDVALAAVFMCSSAATWITATRLTIDGGSVHKFRNFVEMKNAIDKKSKEQKRKFKGKGGVVSKL